MNSSSGNKRPKIGLAGLGTVGTAAAQIMLGNSKNSVELRAVSARDLTKDRGFSTSNLMKIADPVELAQSDEIDIFVEVIGGAEGVAYESVKAALLSGKHVVTANKALLATHGMELATLAEQQGVALRFEAAIAGGIPIVKALREGLKANTITRVVGILNGTCNYILSRMPKENIAFEKVLKDAQDLGYAEADPTFDIGGFDTAHKLALLSSLAFGHQTASDKVVIEGIEKITLADIQIAEGLGYKVKLLGIARQTENGVEQNVYPTLIPKEAAIARVDGVLNAVMVEGDAVGEVMLVGPGAGGNATASAVVGDILDICYGDPLPVYGYPHSEMTPYKPLLDSEHQGGFYVRLSVKDEAGVFADIANAMSKEGISLKSIMQNVASVTPTLQRNENMQDIVLLTHNTTRKKLAEALEQVAKTGCFIDQPQILHIEDSLNFGA